MKIMLGIGRYQLSFYGFSLTCIKTRDGGTGKMKYTLQSPWVSWDSLGWNLIEKA